MPAATSPQVQPAAEYRPSLRARWAAGQPISQLMACALENPQLISLAAGFVDADTLPADPVRQALATLFADPDTARAALQYGTTSGLPLLRQLILEQARAADGPAASLDLQQVVITAGSNQLLHLVSESLLDAGDVVLCAAPTYFVYMGLLTGMGVDAHGVASDRAGMIPEALEDTLRRFQAEGQLQRVKAIYLVPYFDNPAGVTMSLERRAAVVNIAKRWSQKSRIHVISDEAYRELRYWGEDIPSLRACDDQGDTVIVAGTFSKSFSPGIRVGWGLLPRHLVGPVNDQKGNVDFGSPNFNQHLMAHVLESGLFDQHLQRIRDGYRQKLTAMLEAARKYLAPLADVRWDEPRGGLYLWLTLPERIDTGLQGPLFDLARGQGVLYVPGAYCFPTAGQPMCRNTIRLSFGVQSCAKIREGVEKLARAIAAVST
jgi:2-aminoadipate transaminase